MSDELVGGGRGGVGLIRKGTAVEKKATVRRWMQYSGTRMKITLYINFW